MEGSPGETRCGNDRALAYLMLSSAFQVPKEAPLVSWEVAVNIGVRSSDVYEFNEP